MATSPFISMLTPLAMHMYSKCMSAYVLSTANWPLADTKHFRLFLFLPCLCFNNTLSSEAHAHDKTGQTTGWIYHFRALVSDARHHMTYFYETGELLQRKHWWHQLFAVALNHLVPTVHTAWLVKTCLGTSSQPENMFLAQAYVVQLFVVDGDCACLANTHLSL